MSDGPIRVVIVDDSLVAREMLAQILSSDPQITIAGKARDGKEGVEMVARLRPDLVTMDIHMPTMDGLQAVEHIMAFNPTPIMVVSSSVHGTGVGRAFEALQLGALEVIKKPEPKDRTELERIGKELVRKVKTLSRVRVITHLSGRKRVERQAPAEIPEQATLGGRRLVAIGSSTGGPSALMTLLGGLPAEFPVPILVAQHIADGFIPGLVEWLAGASRIGVRCAADGAMPKPGEAYLAPTGLNLEFDGSKMRFVKPTSSQLYIPSADTLFSSVARSMGSAAVGIILTGMGSDGSRGLLEMRAAGAATLGQDESTSIVYGMPRAAAEAGAVGKVVAIDRMPKELIRILAG